MSSLLKELLDEVKANDSIVKNATAPNEAPTIEGQNSDILETSQAMIAKIDNFLQQISGGGEDLGGGPNTSAGNPNPVTDSDPNLGAGTGASSVTLEVPAGMSVKLASVNPIDSDSAIRAIVGLVPSYFSGE